MIKAVIFSLGLLVLAGAGSLSAEPLVAPAVNGVVLQSEGSLYWLKFEEDADTLWPVLKNFWSNEGITLTKEKPQLGYMETDWTKDLLVERFLSIILSDQAPSRRERFRVRVERVPENNGTRVFINHSAYGILLDEEAVYSGYLPASPQLEIEMLSRLARYSGASDEQADQMVSSFSVKQIKAVAVNDNQYDVSVPGSFDFVRKKLIRILDRLNAEVDTGKQNMLVATFDKAPEFKDDDAHWGIDDNSDLEESGFTDYSLGSTNKDRPLSLVYHFSLVKIKTNVLISISSAPGNTEKIDALRRFSETVAKNIQAK